MECRYKALHKCRLCGEVFASGAETDKRGLVTKTMVEMIVGVCKTPQAPTLIDIHYCENGDIGCADFIGWQREEYEEEHYNGEIPF